MKFCVVSGGYNVPEQLSLLCKASVAAQTLPCEHVYYDAAVDSTFSGTSVENQSRIIRALDPETIVCCLDADDYFTHYKVLETVQRVYQDPNVWLTWGSFCFPNLIRGCAGPHTPGVPVRKHPWVYSHLKTFRAGLFQKIQQKDLEQPGPCVSVDRLFMYPMLEMAGEERSVYIEDLLYVYSREGASENERAAGVEESFRLRALPPYEKLTAL